MLTMNRIILLAATLLGCWAVRAQTTPAQIAADPQLSASIYRSYAYSPVETPAVPEGFAPFYISHYGRHGSRWHASEKAYTEPLDALRKADKAGALTPRGQELLAQVEVIAADAEGRYGDLSPRGVAEHRGIAERMFAAYPAVFSTAEGRVCRIESRSTLVPRCILSMAAFNERLKELNPAIQTTRESSERYMPQIAQTRGMRSQQKAAMAVSDSLKKVRIDPARLMSEVFADPQYVKTEVHDPQKLMYSLFMLASIMQDVDYLGISLYDLFQPEELYTLWECENARRYLGMGASLRFGNAMLEDARPLLRNITQTAQEVIDGRRDLAASLRFGHDVNVIPLVALMGVEGASARVGSVDAIKSVWSSERVTPMATNVQLIFFRNAAGDVRVRVMHNERDVRMPVEGGPYYPWPVLRAYFESRYR